MVSAFQNFFQIENPLNIKEVMNQNVCVCSFPIFDISDIHSITAIRCIWSIFDIDSITFKQYHIKNNNNNNLFAWVSHKIHVHQNV